MRLTTLKKEQCEEITVAELAKFIFRWLKEIKKADIREKMAVTDDGGYHLSSVLREICPEIVNKHSGNVQSESFFLKFYEAITRLTQQGLLMYVDTRTTSKTNGLHGLRVRLTSVGEKSEFQDGILILIDDPQEIVNDVKEKVPNLDQNVERCYLESLRACQGGHYLSSVMSLGAASERAIHCLAVAVVEHDENFKKVIEKNRGNISSLTKCLGENVNHIFKSIAEPTFRSELRDKLEGIARIYRLNRNEAIHSDDGLENWIRSEQECYLNQFRRYVFTIFKAIDILENAGKRKDSE